MEISKACVNSHCFSFFLLLLANSLKDRIGFQLSNGNKFSIIVKVWFFYRRGMHSLNSANNLILGFFQHWAKEWAAYINWEPSIRLMRSHHPNLRLLSELLAFASFYTTRSWNPDNILLLSRYLLPHLHCTPLVFSNTLSSPVIPDWYITSSHNSTCITTQIVSTSQLSLLKTFIES